MNDYLLPLPVAAPLLSAALLMAAGDRLPRRGRDLLAILTAAAVAAICGWLTVASAHAPIVGWFGKWTPHAGIALGICFAVDPLGAGLATLSAVLVTAAMVFSWCYFREIGALFPALMLCFLGAMAGFCLTGDLFNLFVFFELMSVAAYALTAYKIEEQASLMGAFNFAATNSIGAFFVLIAIGLLYGRTGALNLAQVGRALAGQPPDGLVVTALVLATVGFGVKAALAPMHFWLDDAHAVAPTPVCVLFSGTMVELGLYAIARVYWTVFAGAWQHHRALLSDTWLAFGVVTAVLGAVMCFAERHLKRLLAFSTISHVGMFFLGFALLTPLGLAGAAIDVLGHGLIKGSLFFAAGILLNRFQSVDTNELQGRGKEFPFLGALMAAGALALSGLPPFATYLGKDLMEQAAKPLGCWWMAPLFLVCSALTGGAILRAAGQVFLGLGPKQGTGASTPKHEDSEIQEQYTRAPLVMILPVAILLGLSAWCGVSPALQRQACRAAERFVDRHAYAATVLEGVSPLAAQEPPAAAHDKTSGLVYGFASAALAVLLAAAGLFPNHLPVRLRKTARRWTQPTMRVLRRVHSGRAGDYTVWVVVGAAVMGALLAL